MTREQFDQFNASASQIFANADWLWNHHGVLGMSVESKRSVLLIRNEVLKMVERVKDTVKEET
jgi:hypothetical protein